MKKAVVALLLILIATSCQSESQKGEIQSCIDRGIKYYQDLGSYPRLSDGRLAKIVVQERCLRTPTAF